MPFPSKYNPTSAKDILRYAKWLIDKTFYDVLKEDNHYQLVSGYGVTDEDENLYSATGYGNSEEDERQTLVSGYDVIERNSYESQLYGNAKRKGGLGNLIEEHFFHYKANSSSEPDFPEAGLELKVTPYEERGGRGKKVGEKYYVAGERLVLTMIDYNARPIEFDLLKSHLWHKCSQILLIYYLRNKKLGDNLKYRIKYVGIFTPSKADLIIISQDYLAIMSKIASGHAHEISEGDTMYLGACTKGSTAAASIVIQIESKIPAQKRAFCFKTSFMTMILNERFINAPDEQESVVTDTKRLKDLGFEGYIQSKFNKYIGKSDREICNMLGIEYTGNKAQWINIAFAILDIKSNRAEEFQKANIVVKSTRIEENGRIRENTSFPPFKFIDLAKEVWLDSDVDEENESRQSTLQVYFSTTKFLFVVFKKQGNNYVLKGCQLWNMPYNDLNITVRDGWRAIQDVIKEGVKFNKKLIKSGKRAGKYDIQNNLPDKDANPIIHIRPHAKKAYYKFDGYENGNPADGNQLPNGDWMTTQCFWLNNTYVKKILRDDLK